MNSRCTFIALLSNKAIITPLAGRITLTFQRGQLSLVRSDRRQRASLKILRKLLFEEERFLVFASLADGREIEFPTGDNAQNQRN